MEDLVSVDGIIAWFTGQVEQKNPISPETWLDACQKLNVLLQGEQENYFDLIQTVAKVRNAILEEGKSVSFARSKMEETDDYKNMCRQKAKIERIIEMIRISKIQARMASDVLRGN